MVSGRKAGGGALDDPRPRDDGGDVQGVELCRQCPTAAESPAVDHSLETVVIRLRVCPGHGRGLVRLPAGHRQSVRGPG